MNTITKTKMNQKTDSYRLSADRSTILPSAVCHLSSLMIHRSKMTLTSLLFIFSFLIACDSGQDFEPATFTVYMHDEPASFEEVNVHIRSVEAGSEGGDWHTLGEPNEIYNLLELINGDKVQLAEGQVEAGRYTRLRLVLGDDHSVVINGASQSLTAGESGVEIDIDADIREGQEYEIVLDFDASRSVTGDAEFTLTPVIRAYEEAETGYISGAIHPAENRARVNALNNGTVFASTITEESSGEFMLLGLEPGEYDLEFIPAGDEQNTLIHSNITVEAGEQTDLGYIGLGASELVGDESWTRNILKPGVELLRQHFDDLMGERRYISLLAFDPNAPDARIRFTSTYLLGGDPHRLPISEYGERSNAVAATNAGFGHGGIDFYNSGILKIEGEVVPFFDDEPLETQFVGSSAVGIDANENWHFKVRDGDNWDDDWEEVEHALAGGHMIMLDGEINQVLVSGNYPTTNERNHATRLHPRTAVCQTSDDVIVLFAVDGRHTQAEGMSLIDLAHFMTDLGCVNAINLDGGGSTTMWTKEHGVVNHPTDNGQFDHEGERILRTAIIVQ